MTTKEYKEMARRLTVRGIEAYKKRMILEEDLALMIVMKNLSYRRDKWN